MIGKTISHYKILEKLGEGGMGVVYKAMDTRLKREVAIKFLRPNFTSSLGEKSDRERFLIEAQAAAALNHPNIATIHTVDETKDSVYIVMEFIKGENLQEMIEKEPIPPDTCVRIIRQIADGLQTAHGNGIVHRDIKSANIMLTAEGRVKILDFGLAKVGTDTKINSSESTLGTLAYMSPEQLSGKKVDHQTDIWALGVILYEMLSRRLPFQGDYAGSMMYAIVNEPPLPITDAHSRFSEQLIVIVEKALAKKSKDRYQSVEEMLADLDKVNKKAGDTREQMVNPGKDIREKTPPSTAVLPFVDMSPEKDQEYFCDGIAEEIIDALAKVEGWRVVSRTSSFVFKGKNQDIREIGDQLNVSHILEGSLRKSGQRIRITAQLTSVVDGFQMWSEKYDRELADVFAIQEDIARTIVEKLKIELGDKQDAPLVKRYTDNLEAHNLYLKARFHFNQRNEEGLWKGIEFCEEAILKDPEYAPAYAGIAEGNILLGFLGAQPPGKLMPKAKEAAMHALQLDNSLADAHTTLGCIKGVYDWDWEEAEKDFQHALALSSNHATAHHWYAINLLVPQGRFDEAMSEIQRARELDPMSQVINMTAGLIYYFKGDYDRALEQYNTVSKIDATFGLVHLFRGRTYEQIGKYDLAMETFEKWRAFGGNFQEAMGELGNTFAVSGNEIEALKILDELIDLHSQNNLSSNSMFAIAAIYASLKDHDSAIEWLNHALKEHSIRLIYLKVSPQFESLREDPRFQDVLKTLNL